MSKISLQAYEDEIDLLIEQARYVEALAHLRHLLAQFPHYIGAYYLLGKTMLEADLPDLAVDMFRRALSADSNHLLSRIGLGLAHERRNDLDAALWNLERALESDPRDGDVAEELRRMYERREGVELAYVPQTRAGLARLYLRASRYGRAAEEFAALLEEQPARPDLMTALAEAYWRNGQLVQAAELCQEILDALPYNLRANLLLGTLWVNGGQDEGWIYLQRAQEVDPENRCAEELFESDALLAPQDLQVDRLMYEPDAIQVGQDSSWFKRLENVSISVGISEAPPEMSAAEVRLVDITAGLESQIEIPDWLRELGGDQAQDEGGGGLGWMSDIDFEALEEEAGAEVDAATSQGIAALETAFGVESEVDAQPPTEDEEAVPDWLQALASDARPFDIEAPKGAPDWLRELVDEGAPEADAEATVSEDAAVDDLEVWGEPEAEGSDWLGELEAVVGEAPEGETTGDEDLLAWMRDEFPETASPDEPALLSDELPDWLSELKAQTGLETGVDEGHVEPEPAEVPDWLSALEAQTVTEVETVEDQPEDQLAEEEGVPDWLAELATSVSADIVEDEGLAAAVDLELEDVPDWLSALEAQTVTEIETVEEQSEDQLAEEEGLPDWLAELAPAGFEEALVGVTEEDEGLTGEDALAWLERLAADYPGEVEPSGGELTQFESPAELPEEPSWAPDDLAVSETVGVADTVIEGVTDLDLEGETGDLLSGDDALAWLESLTIGKEEELRAEAEQASADRVAEILGRRREVPPEATPEAPALVEDQVPDVGDETFAEIEDAVVEQAWAPSVEVDAELADQLTVTPEVEPSPDDGELLSGDDALAWLESLTIGKEEELRAEAEQASADRVAEILGRRREVPSEEKLIAEAEPAEEEAPEAAPAETLPEEPETWDDTLTTTPVEVVDAEETQSVDEAPVEPAETVAGEDALSWLEGLSPDEEAALREQVEAEDVTTVTEEPPARGRFFGWSAFDGGPEEVSSEVDVPVEIVEPLDAGEEVEVAAITSGEELAGSEQISADVTLPEPAAEQTPAVPEAEAQAEADVAPSPETEVAPTPALRPEATPSEAAESDLDALREYVKQKRSDHSARLRLGRELWEIGEAQEAMQHYTRLIKSSAKTDDVMADLQRYAEEKPEAPGVLRTLGDAYMKFGDLDKALEIFNRAMDQL